MEPQTQTQQSLTPQLDPQLVRSLNRQMKVIKLLLVTFFVMFIAMLAILGFIAYKVITFTQGVNDRISNLQSTAQESLDVKSKVCSNSTLATVLGNNDLCK